MYPNGRRVPRRVGSKIGAVTVRMHRSRTARVGSAAAVGLLVGVLSVLAGVLSGCGASDDASPAPAPTDAAETYEPTTEPESVEPETEPVSVEPAASGGDNEGDDATNQSASAAETRPEILLLDTQQLNGQQFDLAAAAGNDVLVWFWAPW